ncbi:MAG: hypothetical protein V1492_00425 [Candidatus Micrarchaeota archaeon]
MAGKLNFVAKKDAQFMPTRKPLKDGEARRFDARGKRLKFPSKNDARTKKLRAELEKMKAISEKSGENYDAFLARVKEAARKGALSASLDDLKRAIAEVGGGEIVE